nr:hypothetical protein [Solirubrobacterales bacterium]
ELTKLRALRERLDAAGAAGDARAVFSRSAALLRESAAVSRATLDRIEALERPPKAEDEIAAWIARSRRQATLTDTLADAYEARDDARVAQLTGRLDEGAAAAGEAAKRLGMRTCAERVQE